MVTTAERRMRRAYRTGAELDLTGVAHNVVRAEFLAELLLDGPGAAGGRIARANLKGARISGQLDLTGARIDTPLRLRHCDFDETVLFDHADLVSLNMDESVLPGIEAEAVRVASGFGVRNARIAGDVWLLQAQVNGTVELDRCTVGGTLHLQRAVVGGGVHLRDGMSVTGGIKLAGARIGGDLALSGARVGATGEDRAAIAGPGLTVGGGLLAHRLHADGGINLIGAQVGGSVAFNDCVLRCPDGNALMMIEAQARLLTLRPAAGSVGRISLRDAHFGRFVDDPVTWPAGCRIELDGLTYDRLTRRSEDSAEWSASQRLTWMARYSTGFSPGPYEQLAAALRRDGREQEARQVLLVRERLRHRAMGRLGAAWGAIQNIGIGFGYHPVRALLWLVAVIAAGTGWFAASGPLQPVKPDEAPTWDPFLYTLDVLVPLIDLGHDKAWDPVGMDKAVTLTVMAVGWILATTVVAGAGRALRR
jgi:hypothetical protein